MRRDSAVNPGQISYICKSGGDRWSAVIITIDAAAAHFYAPQGTGLLWQSEIW
jgi:hypothetical protein